MSRVRVYIKPFNTDGEYEDDFTEITEDVLKIGEISRGLDNNEYDVGVYRNSNFSITLNNYHGKYLDVDRLESIFAYKRDGSQVKVTWDRANHNLSCGFFKCGYGSTLPKEVILFEGLLTDVSGVSKIADQDIKFEVLGFESLFDKVETPYADITVADKFSEILLALLNQTEITGILTVSADNLNPDVDQAIDSKDDLENTTVAEALSEILLLANSVLYIKDRTVYVSSRDAGANLEHTFYGPAANDGIENVIDIQDFRDGSNRIFNYWTWSESSTKSSDNDSVAKNGVRKKELDSGLISTASSAKITAILGALKDEFKDPEAEMKVVAPLTYDTQALELLSRVAVDYPTVHYPADSNPVPRYGQAIYGTSRYPYPNYSLTVSSDRRFKIMNVGIKPLDEIITFGLREI